MPPAARVTDMHVCPMVTVLVPHVGGPILPPCAMPVLISGLPAARITDMLVCVGPPDIIVQGSFTVLIQGLPAARMFDMTAHGGVIVLGDFKTWIGDSGSGSGGGGGGMAAPAPPAMPAMPAMPNPPALPMPDLPSVPSVPAPPDPEAAFKAATQNIKISGDAAFQEKVTKDLHQIYNTPTGKGLLESIQKSGKTVEIKPTANPGDGNATGYKNAADRFKAADGTPGKGTDSVVYYNPDRTKIGDEDWATRPPAIGLGHELVHAEQASYGKMAPGDTDNDHKPDPSDPSKTAQERVREVEAAGIPPNDTYPYTENKLRDEWNPKQPQRPWY
ncbi:MAG TPA: M91 family zinc metallopeptidase [Bryobacteraceae bacterium]|jgi:type VI secretion system secreted protein VgrG